MPIENLKFRIELYSTYWQSPPFVDVKVNDTSYYTGKITSSIDKPTIIEFTAPCEEGKEYTLKIVRSNKGARDTVLDHDKKIIKDQLLNIKNIQIDDIDIDALIFEGEYRPDYPEPWLSQQQTKPPAVLKNSVNLGHNGTWSLKIKSPFYMWLLENLY
tara:strand:- start:1141 stop:1614 length:474 start_codon:yes stop_codon:yes gene_type:complete